jgi:uncharacterized membrane protein YfcA
VPTVSVADAVGLLALGLFAGWLGAVVGIGGGIVVVPALVIGFGYEIRTAVASSLVVVVATSTAAGSAYVGEGLANMRLGMTLEIATTIGGMTGGLVAVVVAPSTISGVFAVMMLVTAALVLRNRDELPGPAAEPGAAADWAPARPPAAGAGGGDAPGADATRGFEIPGQLAGSYFDHQRGTLVAYRPERLAYGSAISFVAGALSGLLGVGGGFLKVPAMALGMRVPIKVAAATSNFMIGVTAIASLFLYFARGYLHPAIAVPVALGVVVGALAGAKTSAKVSPGVLRRILAVVLLVVAIQMALDAFGISLGR